ncbi:MAG TPA: ABC transporter permease [Cyclobacteriaceae bacterium]|nr:ABC transporter permease [Cyclobacteriaceae bacterium]
MNRHSPPRLAQTLFDWFCKDAAVEDLKGDMDEMFIRNLARMSASKARWIYWRQVLSLIFSYAVKKRRRKKQQTTHHSYMLSNLSLLGSYFVTATRNLAKQRFFTIINVIGLATGMSVSLLVIAITSFIYTYDDFHANKDRIYRIITHVDSQQYSNDFASCPAPLYDKLTTLNGVDNVVRLSTEFSYDVSHNNGEPISLRGYFADPAFLTVFNFPLQHGNKNTALSLPNSLVITPAAALRIFGTEDAVGKTLQVGDKGLFEVTGVFMELPKNTHFSFEAVASYKFIDREIGSQVDGPDRWKKFLGSYLYLQFDETSDPKAYVERTEQALANISADQYAIYPNYKASFSLQSLEDITPGIELSNSHGREWGSAGVTTFFVLTLLILLPACFNYTNISISRALTRSKEIGLRKMMGGQRSQIFSQFVLETVIITLVALVGAVAIFIAVRNQFIAMMVDTPIHSFLLEYGSGLELSLTFKMVSWFFLFAVVVGLLTGIVPAIYFSKLNPIDSLKKVGRAGTVGSLNIRKVLITAQFALSLVFIMCVVVAYQQHRGSIGYNFGFNRENILTVDIRGIDPQLFRNQFSKLSQVRAMSYSSHIPGASGSDHTFVVNSASHDSTEVFRMFADHGQIATFGLTLLAGTNFTDDYNKCGNNIIVNEAFVTQFKLGRPVDAVGRLLTLSDGQEVRVVGVMKDFQYMHLEEGIKSFFYQCDVRKFRYAFLAVQSTDIISTLISMEAAWKPIGGERKFTSKFLDDYIQEAYDLHLSLVKICGFLGALAISISCLGMVGMVVFTVQNRVKEVGVRKVMGATSGTIAYILSKDFVKLMMIASAIAIPITWLFLEKIYFRVQTYSVPIGAFEIVTSLAILFVLGLATIFSQTLKAAAANPVDSLRHE